MRGLCGRSGRRMRYNTGHPISGHPVSGHPQGVSLHISQALVNNQNYTTGYPVSGHPQGVSLHLKQPSERNQNVGAPLAGALSGDTQPGGVLPVDTLSDNKQTDNNQHYNKRSVIPDLMTTRRTTIHNLQRRHNIISVLYPPFSMLNLLYWLTSERWLNGWPSIMSHLLRRLQSRCYHRA